MRKVLQMGGYVVFLLVAFGCSKEEKHNNIPYAKVEFNFYPYTIDSELASYGGIKLFPRNGYNANGVFVCQYGMADQPLFMAFDATCPMEEETGFKTPVIVAKDGSMFKLVCPKCGTTFDLRSEGRGGGTRLSRYGVKELGFKTYYQVRS